MNSTRFCPPSLTASSFTLFAGPDTPSPLVFVFQCAMCHARFYGQPLLRELACEACGEGPLQEIGTWDLRTEPWWPLLSRGGRGGDGGLC